MVFIRDQVTQNLFVDDLEFLKITLAEVSIIVFDEGSRSKKSRGSLSHSEFVNTIEELILTAFKFTACRQHSVNGQSLLMSTPTTHQPPIISILVSPKIFICISTFKLYSSLS